MSEDELRDVMADEIDFDEEFRILVSMLETSETEEKEIEFCQGGGKDGDLSDDGDRVVPQSFNLITFIIVGVKGGTRKRPRGRLSGSWWTGCGWGPGERCPWKVGRRRIVISECPAEDVEVMEIESILKERTGWVVEQSTDCEMNIQEGHLIEAVRDRKCGTDFQQPELMDTDTELGRALSSDKDKKCLTGCWAQECPFAGTAERASFDQGHHHHHPGVAGLTEEGRDQARDTTAEVGSIARGLRSPQLGSML